MGQRLLSRNTARYRLEGMTLAPGMTTENDSDLAAAARAGDRQAFAELYNRYRGMVHAILLAHARPGEPDDLVQDVFMRALQKIAGLRDTYAFGGWLASIARHRATDFFRRTKPERELMEVGRGAPQSQVNARQSYAGFESTFMIDRTEFGVNGGADARSLISKEVSVHLVIGATRERGISRRQIGQQG